MTFLAPAFLALATAALVPLLIHLLRRRIGKRMEFPAARYLVRAERENSRRMRLRNLLLMLLRVLAVLLIALAAASPIGRVAGVGHAPAAIAIVVDNSLSSSVIIDGHPLLNTLRDAALDVASQAGASDRVWLVTADGEAHGGSIAVVRASIERLEPLAGSGDMAVAIARASALVDGSGYGEKRLAIATDGQRFEWQNVDRIDVADASVTAFLPVAILPANRSVSSVEARPSRWTPRGEVIARVSSADSVTYRIDIAGRALARGTAAPGEEIILRASPHERGWVSGVVEIQPDEFRADDERHYAVWIGSAPAVRISQAAGPFVINAIDALVDAGRLARGSEISIAPADEVERLPALIFPPPDPVRLGAANRSLERLGVPWRFGDLVRAAAAVRPVDGGQWTDPGVSLRLRYRLEPRVGAELDTLARVQGEPWLVAGDGYVLFASPMDPDATNLPVRASFISLVTDLVTQRLSGERGSVIAAFPSRIVQRPPWADALAAEEGFSQVLQGSTFSAPARAGVYFFSRAGRRSGALVVNPPAGEFELSRIPDAELRRKFSSDEVRVTADPQRWVRDVYESAGRRPLILPFLLVALGALVLESFISREGGTRDAAG